MTREDPDNAPGHSPALVDIAVPMARHFREEDERDPASVLRRRREAAARVVANGFTRDEAATLYGADAVTGIDTP